MGFLKNEKAEQEVQEINIIREIISMLLYIIVVMVMIWLIINYVGQRTEVSGESMNATLEDADHLWIDKLSYHFKEPKRFDIVVFPYQDTSIYYIKRIIGLPGETIYIDEEGQIHINGEILEEDYGLETIDPFTLGRAERPVTLGDDEYFVMGDNRNNSKDSRTNEVGNVHRKEIEGKVAVRIWPLGRFGKVD